MLLLPNNIKIYNKDGIWEKATEHLPLPLFRYFEESRACKRHEMKGILYF